MENGELEIIKKDVEEIKVHLAFLLSRYLEEEDVEEEEKKEIMAILEDMKRGNYITKEELQKELLEGD